ncbi:MAG: hypothetical protein CBC49_001310 [Alphaproteobacteria bacterium TMED89]|nr:MAG: hypothetical protein CBC49_001310 [Alphaproteobacteria bacterium TMED89]
MNTTTMEHLNDMPDPNPMQTRRPAIFRHVLIGITAGITLGGCAAPTATVRTVDDPPMASKPSEDPWQASLEADFDRSDWPPIRFEIPLASVPCNPTYATPVVPDDGAAGRLKETGAFPTIDTAMSIGTDRATIRRAAVTEPFVAAFDLVASPFRMIGAPPDSTVLEPNGDWILLPGCEPRAVTSPEPSMPENTDDAETTTDPSSTDAPMTAGGKDTAPTTTGDSARWTIRPVFDRPADATTRPETDE